MEDLLTTLRGGLEPGYNALLGAEDDPEVGLDFGVHLLPAGTSKELTSPARECAWLVIRGRGTLTIGSRSMDFARPEWIATGPTVAHGPAGSRCEVIALDACEVAQVAVEGGGHFEPRLLGPAEVPTEHRGRGMLEEASYRLVRCAFDGQTAPAESRLVLGEVVSFPGRWSSYPPHHHPQPEIYYYRFAPEQGYGHGELGERVFRLRGHDLLRITGDRDHAQVSAPGYHMYYIWAIRHLPGSPYTGFEFNPEHAWLLEEQA
jgi:5-deoxy-glucuronate isomerase